MEIHFKTKKLQKICSQTREMRRRLGPNMAKKLQQRLMELSAADNLSDISHLSPPRLHELSGNRAGQFSVDLEHPNRLLFIPAEDPIPRSDDSGIDQLQISKIEIIAIEDTH